MQKQAETERRYETVIGLEVHVQLKTKTKLFSPVRTDFGAPPNSQVGPICTGEPGVLPVLNKKAVEGIVKVGLALGCTINKRSYFARKQYFYPDLPKGYQISQSDQPFCRDGAVDIGGSNGSKTIRIERIHLEEDAGKLLHAIGATELPYSLVDLNRAGIPLMEIVSRPDLSGPDEAVEYLQILKATIQYIGVSDCDMEKGSLRCDANVSIRPEGDTKLGTRVEIKNMNSFRSVKDAIAYEVDRQIQLAESGDRMVQETRLWNESQGATFSMRSKEESHDYRYFPDPDLVPCVLTDPWINEVKASLPELPKQRRARLEAEFGLTPYDSGVLISQRELVDYYETALSRFSEKNKKAGAKPLANWITTELMGRLNKENKTILTSPISADHMAELVEMVVAGTLSGKMGKDIFAEVFETGASPKEIVDKRGLSQVSDEGELGGVVDQVIAENPKIVADIKGGKDRALGSLVGQVMKKTKGRANPQLANKLLKEKIK